MNAPEPAADPTAVNPAVADPGGEPVGSQTSLETVDLSVYFGAKHVLKKLTRQPLPSVRRVQETLKQLRADSVN